MVNQELLLQRAPAALRTQEEGPHSSVSSKYQFMTTNQVVNLLNDMGWYVTDARQQRSKGRENVAKHMIRFRNGQFARNVNDNFPEIVLTNSHDGRSSFRFMAGIFRLICSNGLVVKSQDFGDISVKHIHQNFDEVIEAVRTITVQIPKIIDKIDLFGGIELNETQRIEFAEKAVALRFPKYINPETGLIQTAQIQTDFNITELLEPLRPQDADPSLWNVFNGLQERFIKGEFSYITEKGKNRKGRAINGIHNDIAINQSLWELAESFLN